MLITNNKYNFIGIFKVSHSVLSNILKKANEEKSVIIKFSHLKYVSN